MLYLPCFINKTIKTFVLDSYIGAPLLREELMKVNRILPVAVTLLLLFCLILYPNYVYAGDGESDPYKSLKSDEKAFALNMRHLIAAARGQVGDLRSRMNDTDLQKSPEYLIKACSSIVSSSASAPIIFQPLAGECAGLDKLAMSAGTDAYAILEQTNKIKSSTILAPFYGINRLIQKRSLNSNLDKINAKLDAIEATLDKCIKETTEYRQKSTDWFKCFIATAAYGTPSAREIDVLRDFRDHFLIKQDWGRQFIDFYYTTSPPLAEFISRHELSRTVVREVFVNPIVCIVDLIDYWWNQH